MSTPTLARAWNSLALFLSLSPSFSLSLSLFISLSLSLWPVKRVRERGRERKREGGREREKEGGGREREGWRENCDFFKGMTGALAPFSYLVIYIEYSYQKHGGKWASISADFYTIVRNMTTVCGMNYKTLRSCDEQKMDRLRSKLAFLLLSLTFTELDKHCSLQRNVGPYLQHLIFFSTYEWVQWAKVTLHLAFKRLYNGKHSSLLRMFVSYGENEVLWKRHL